MKPKKIDIEGYNAHMGVETLHPLVSVINFNDIDEIHSFLFNIDFYAVFLKETKIGTLTYGRQNYDYKEGSIVCVSPGQVLGIDAPAEKFKPTGWGVLFHPDFLFKTELGKNLKKYTYFGYDSNEALHLAERERSVIIECFRNIQTELERPIDKHSQKLIATYIELLLDYCNRFYDRQFITRNKVNSDVIVRFEQLVNEYFASDRPSKEGLPEVKMFASQLCLSPNYFGDLIRKECGISPQEYIQNAVIRLAKERLMDTSSTVAQVADSLGFQYSPYFSRLFKKVVGQTPSEFRMSV